MTGFIFDWDESKNQSNKRKHGVSFQESTSVFCDLTARLISDPDHAEHEDRFLILGMSNKLRILIICHCYRDKDNVIRIISARKATRTESKTYKEYTR